MFVFQPQVFLFQIVIIIAIAIFLFFLLRELRTIRLQKRFEKFALASLHIQEKSTLDRFDIKLWSCVKKFRHILSKSEFLKKYSKKYDRFISYEEKESKTGMDYITIKFISAFCFFGLNFLTILFRPNQFGFMSLLLTFLLGFYLPDLFLAFQFGKKQKMVNDDLLKAIIVMNNSFKSGRNIMQAVDIVKRELEGPIKDEFKKIYMDMTYGLSVEIVFNRFYERVKLEDAKYISSSLSLLNTTGGNIVRVFGSIEKSIFNKKKLRNEMKSLTAASIFVYRILVFLPLIFSFLIFVLNPTYFNPFFKTPFGLLLFLLIIILYISYIVVIKKVLKVKSL